jgi:hypothetical protein
MHKYYNPNDCAIAITALYEQEFTREKRANKALFILVGELLNYGISLKRIANAIQYDVAFIADVITLSGEPVLFSVWCGGTEVNAHLLTIDDAITMEAKYRKQGYDDVAIGAYLDHASIDKQIPYNETRLRAICEKAYRLADIGEHTVSENTEEGISFSTDNDTFRLSKSVYYHEHDKDVAPETGVFTLVLTNRAVDFTFTFGAFSLDIHNLAQLANNAITQFVMSSE